MEEFDWENNVENKKEKLEVAKKIVSRVKDNEIIGFGSGTTSYIAILEIIKKVKKDNLHIKAIPTSNIIENLCKKLGIETTTLENDKPDWCFDGADEVDENFWLIKGMGAALYREKQNIKASSENYILVDKTKLVKKLGINHPVPVECDEEKIDFVKQELLKLGAKKVILKMSNNDETKPLITDNNKVLLYAWFDEIKADFEEKIRNIPGVLESGLFIGYNVTIIK